jgi:hypothetical protein
MLTIRSLPAPLTLAQGKKGLHRNADEGYSSPSLTIMHWT